MRKLISLVGGLVFLTSPLFSQEIKPAEDPYKFIPKGTECYHLDIDGDGKIEIYWWDKNENFEMEDDEIFIDLNGDEIPDCNYSDYKEWKKLSETLA
ncbi:MAG: hypothetical protein PHQ66_02810 [Candidatus Nanoarchaeia archaeon]|nr:hypothetical protein [Candidatus Nanoarchaeia archaeon]MDD5357704.1 hypothetical protein [Candidatus Nanoarchaeia archaeon]MDD5588623.1 hypothetical protein [Candidatus Nanoarchaeia archaeon]